MAEDNVCTILQSNTLHLPYVVSIWAYCSPGANGLASSLDNKRSHAESGNDTTEIAHVFTITMKLLFTLELGDTPAGKRRLFTVSGGNSPATGFEETFSLKQVRTCYWFVQLDLLSKMCD